MDKVLKKSFFQRDTLLVAQDLLGKFLVKKEKGQLRAVMIKEVEAYDGLQDKASHVSRGKTARNKIMFTTAGHWYLYLIYGMYWMLNITTGPVDYPAAVLIRKAGKFTGPGKLTRDLKIDKKFNHLPTLPQSNLWIADRGVKIKSQQIEKLKRIGVNYAQEWKDKLYRFRIDGSQ